MAQLVKYVVAWAPAGIWMAVIWTLSSIPGSALPPTRDIMSVGAHIVEYGVLGFLFAQAFSAHGIGKRKRWAFAVLSAVAFGVADEIHQVFVPGRDASAADIAVDAISAVGGSALNVVYFSGIRRKRKDGV